MNFIPTNIDSLNIDRDSLRFARYCSMDIWALYEK